MLTADLRGFSRLIAVSYTDEKFESCRQNCIQQLETRLALLRRREEIRRYELPVSGLALEYKFAELLCLVLRRRAEYPPNASYLIKNSSEEQLQVIYARLEEIIEQVPWRGIQYTT
jgi:hypothetical protein